jgi:hypothetical protein
MQNRIPGGKPTTRPINASSAGTDAERHGAAEGGTCRSIDSTIWHGPSPRSSAAVSSIGRFSVSNQSPSPTSARGWYSGGKKSTGIAGAGNLNRRAPRPTAGSAHLYFIRDDPVGRCNPGAARKERSHRSRTRESRWSARSDALHLRSRCGSQPDREFKLRRLSACGAARGIAGVGPGMFPAVTPSAITRPRP